MIPSAQPHIAALSPYRPGMPVEALARTYGLRPDAIIKLASNENPYGMSPRAEAAAAQALQNAQYYPDGWTLRTALAERFGIDESQLVLGNGSNDVLDLIARVFLAAGTTSVSSQHAFIVYRLVTTMAGAKNTIVPAASYGHDLDAMHQAITETTKVIWIANPNNPTGTFVPYDKLAAWLATVPPHVIVVLDEAYYEYLADNERADTVAWLVKHPNLIIVRTFSKAYGLAGLRVGYALAAPAVADLLNRVRQPFNVNNAAIAAATASLEDESFVDECRSRNEQGRQQLQAGFDALGLSYLPAYGNFITVAFDDAAAVHQSLLSQGIIVRPVAEYELPNYLRISVGKPEDNARLLTALAAIARHP